MRDRPTASAEGHSVFAGDHHPHSRPARTMMAGVELHRMMAEASTKTTRGGEVTFKQAATEYLRYVEHVRQIDIATVKDYRGVIDGYLLDEFGAQRIAAITPDLIDAYKERLIAEGRLSPR